MAGEAGCLIFCEILIPNYAALCWWGSAKFDLLVDLLG